MLFCRVECDLKFYFFLGEFVSSSMVKVGVPFQVRDS